jgi:hypothetical protein
MNRNTAMMPDGTGLLSIRYPLENFRRKYPK